MEWYHTAIPQVIVEEIKKIYLALGYPTVGQFIAEAARRHVARERNRWEEMENDRKLGRTVQGKDD